MLAVGACADDFVGGTVSSVPMQEAADEELQALSDAASAEEASSLSQGSTASRGRHGQEQSMVHGWQAGLKDLFSHRVVTVRKVDLTAMALEGVAIGAAAVTVLAVLLKNR